jgi:hypothetical protein
VTQALCTDLTHLETSERGESCWVSGIKNQSARGARRKPHRKIRHGAAGAGDSCDLVEECHCSVGRTPEYGESRSPTKFAMCSQDSIDHVEANTRRWHAIRADCQRAISNTVERAAAILRSPCSHSTHPNPAGGCH